MVYSKEFFADFVLILNEMSPYLLLGLFVAGLMKVFLPEAFITKYLRKRFLYVLVAYCQQEFPCTKMALQKGQRMHL